MHLNLYDIILTIINLYYMHEPFGSFGTIQYQMTMLK